MPRLTTKEISRKKLKEIISYGKKNKLMTKEDAIELTKAVDRHIYSNYRLLRQGKLTLGDMDKKHTINLTDAGLKLLIQSLEARIQELQGKETFPSKEILKYVLYGTAVLLAIISPFILLTTATTGGSLPIVFFIAIAAAVASGYSLSPPSSLYSLQNTLITLKKFDVTANDTVQTVKASSDQNSYNKQREIKKTYQSSPDAFFSSADTVPKPDSSIKQTDTKQFGK